LDYSFDVLISRIGNWAYITGFATFTLLVASLPTPVCWAHDTIFNTCSLTQIYRYTCAYLCTSLGTHLATRWGVSDSPGPVCSDLRAWTVVNFLVIGDAQR